MVDLRIGDLKKMIKDLPNEMLVVIPVVDEDNVNQIYGFRKVRTAGILQCETEEDPEAFCLNGSADELDLKQQVHFSDRDAVDCVDCIFPSIRWVKTEEKENG